MTKKTAAPLAEDLLGKERTPDAASVVSGPPADTLASTPITPSPASLAAIDTGTSSRQVETERYALLIEIAGLVVHDLSSPLYALMCATELLSQDPSKAQGEAFRSVLRESTARAFDLINTLKDYLRTPDVSPRDQVLFGDAMADAERVLRLRLMLPLSFETARHVAIMVDPPVRLLLLAISRADLMHVLMNIIGNGYLAAQGGPSAEPMVEVALGTLTTTEALLLISDNGPGLSQYRFAALTGAADGAAISEEGGSMGLRLVRRLIERKHGSLRVASAPRLGSGTTFEISIPLFQDD